MASSVVRCFVFGLAVLLAQASHAVPVVLNFEGLADLEPINDYYNGGLGGFGSGPGPDHDITFGTDSLAIVDEDAGGGGNFANEPSPNTVAFFLAGSGVVMNVLSGFTTGFSFFYSSSAAASVTVYDGLNTAGNVLANLPLGAQGGASEGCNAAGDPNGYFACWTATGVAFAGTAYSVSFEGAQNLTGFDNITLESSTPIPEPSLQALLWGAGLIGLAARRRRGRQGR
jgi:hypothetical protein